MRNLRGMGTILFAGMVTIVLGEACPSQPASRTGITVTRNREQLANRCFLSMADAFFAILGAFT